MSLSEEVQKHIRAAYLDPAKQRGESTIRVKAGDVHRDLHWVNRVPSVCTTLSSRKFQRETGLELLSKSGPPSGNSTTVVFTYRLSKDPVEAKTSGSVSLDSSNQHEGGRWGTKSLLERLYGIAADVSHDLEGGEAFLRKEREELRFRAEDDQSQGEEPR